MRSIKLSLFILLLLYSGAQRVVAQQKQPNIILLMAEDISNDLECYGMKGVKTPYLNQLAEEGIRFDRCYSTSPICSPNRSAMIVGVHQSKINAQHHRGNQELALQEPYKPFTYWLRKAGYMTILGNEKVLHQGEKIDVNFKHAALGEWDGVGQFGLFDKKDEFIQSDQPFFAQIQLKVTHRGDWWEEIHQKVESPVDPDQVELPSYFSDNEIIRKDWAMYLDQIAYMDTEVGQLIKDLKAQGIYENTVIIFVGDNGRCNIRGKGYLYEPGLKVPLIISGPGFNSKGEIRNDLVSTIDVTATVLDIAGVKLPTYMDGQSVFDPKFNREYVYSARDQWDEILDKSRSITSGKYKYIKNYMPEVPYDAHQAYLEFHRPALHVMRKEKLEGKLSDAQSAFFSAEKPKEELYDLTNDPDELVNLANNSDYESILISMRQQLAKEEAYNSVKEVYDPSEVFALEVLEYVKYEYPEDYIRLLSGEHIGYAKYAQLLRSLKSKNKESNE
ncbi:MAG: sulfatase [Rickettsiales bacterium]|nr:sulfatase [Rickettsiales bacterium]